MSLNASGPTGSTTGRWLKPSKNDSRDFEAARRHIPTEAGLLAFGNGAAERRRLGGASGGRTVQRLPVSGIRLGVNTGTHTASSEWAPSWPSDADAGHRQILGVEHIQVVARREAIGRRDDVGLAPADELLAGVDREPAARDGRVEPADRQQRPLDARDRGCRAARNRRPDRRCWRGTRSRPAAAASRRAWRRAPRARAGRR